MRLHRRWRLVRVHGERRQLDGERGCGHYRRKQRQQAALLAAARLRLNVAPLGVALLTSEQNSASVHAQSLWRAAECT